MSDDDDDDAMVYDAAALLPGIIERLRQEDPNSPIVKNIDACAEYIARRYGSIHPSVTYDAGGLTQ